MNGFIFDANLPGDINFTPSAPLIAAQEIAPNLRDRQIWEFARRGNLVIVSKDADFSAWMITSTPPPRVVHIRFGNLKKARFHAVLSRAWPQIEAMLKTHKLINVYLDRIEAIS